MDKRLLKEVEREDRLAGVYVPVLFNGKRLHARMGALEGKVDGALSGPEHVQGGELMSGCFEGDSYAVLLKDGTIWRYGRQIGTRMDIQMIRQRAAR